MILISYLLAAIHNPEYNPLDGMKPSSIFDRKRQERSAYLKSQGTTIQKAFGES